MIASHPLIPAEAGTQSFGHSRYIRRSNAVHTGAAVAQTWVPASAGMSGE